MHLTVAICTWNRSRLLVRTFEHMATVLRVPEDVDWELLVVNNACTDDTDAVIDGYRDRLPIRRLFEPEQGLSRARNRAASQAEGAYIIWTDDDVLVDEQWLAAYCRAFRHRPEAALFGGPIDPQFLNPNPAWLDEVWAYVQGTYAVLDLGAHPVPLTAERLPYGANMAVRAREQKQFLYDVRFGHRGSVRLAAEETAVMRQILAAHGSGWWVPQARVRHLIPADRQTLGYLRTYYFGRGQRLVLEALDRGDTPAQRGACLLRAGFWECVYRMGRLLTLPPMWIRALQRGWIARGCLDGLLRYDDTSLPVPRRSASAPAERASPPSGRV